MENIFMNDFNNRLEVLRLKEKNFDYVNSVHNSGFLYDCFIKKDEDLFFIMDLVFEKMEDFNDIFIEVFHKKAIQELIFIEKQIDEHPEGEVKESFLKFYKGSIETIQKNLEISSINEFMVRNLQQCKDFFQGYSNAMEVLGNYCDESFFNKYYPLKSIIVVFTKDYSAMEVEKKSVSDLETSDEVKRELKRIYGDEKILDRYNLFKFTDDFFMYYKELNYIKDKRGGEKYFMLSVSKELLGLIDDLINKKFVNDVSFQIESIFPFSFGFEEKAYGVFFDYDIESLVDISMFYNIDDIDNKLYVFVIKEDNKVSLTFETSVSDFFMDDDCNVATNLVHLEVIKKDGVDVISHIDHEYIIYKAEDYERRIGVNPEQRGFHKIKTFKIDGASIPFNYNFRGIPVLYFFLLSCMDNKDLIHEYFKNVVNGGG